MSWSQRQQSGDWYDQLTVLIGSAVRLLCGEAGVFVVSNEAFDPQSSAEYASYGVAETVVPLLLTQAQEGRQPNSAHPLVINPEPLHASLVAQLGLYDIDAENIGEGDAEKLGASKVEVMCRKFERCSLFVHDPVGVVGYLHFVRSLGAISCFEQQQDAKPGGSAGGAAAVHRTTGGGTACRVEVASADEGAGTPGSDFRAQRGRHSDGR